MSRTASLAALAACLLAGCCPACMPSDKPSTRPAGGTLGGGGDRGGDADHPALLSPRQAHHILKTDPRVFLLCVATRDEYDDGHIPGSVLIPARAIRSKIADNDLWPEINKGRTPRKDQPIIVYCWWKPCDCPWLATNSDAARAALKDLGYSDVSVIDGGMITWLEAGLPSQRSRK